MGVFLKKRLMIFVIIQLIILLYLSIQVMGLGVCRTITPRICEPGSDIVVSLEIEPDASSEVMAVDDVYPSEFSLVSKDNDLYDDEQYHIKYLNYDSPTTETLQYTLTAPSTEGTYSFSGIWMVDMMSDSSAISCDNQVEVDASPPDIICSDIDSMGDCDSQVNCTWCSIYGSSGACIDSDDWECDAIECGSSDDEYCHNCQWNDCQSGYTCEAGQCVLPATPTPTPTPTETLSPTPTPCTPDWEVGDWGECDGTYESRTVTDNNDCGTSDGKPSTKRRCGRGDSGDDSDDDDSPETGRTRPPRNTGDDPDDESTGLTRGEDDDLSDDGSGLRRTREPDTTPIQDEEIDDTEDDAGSTATGLDYLFYVLIIILVLMVGGFLFYYVNTKNKGGKSKPGVQNNLFANPPAGGVSGPANASAGNQSAAQMPQKKETGKF